MIMCGEKRLGAHLIVQMLDHAPRQAQPVKRAGATANLVEDNEAARRGVVQNIGRLAHLHHEGGLPARQIVARPDAREDAVHQVNPRLHRRNERARVRQQHQQRHLADIRALARHVRPGNESNLREFRRAARQRRVIRHEALFAQTLFEDWMAPLADE